MSVALSIWLLVCSLFITHPNWIATEPALYLRCAELITAGKTPYVDFLVMDWPSTILFALPPAMVQNSHSTWTIPAFNLFALAFSLASIALTASLLLPLSHHRQWHYFPAVVLSLSLANTILIFQIGQPQYLAFYALLPYLIVRWLRYGGSNSSTILSVACGLLAAIGILIYPFAAAAPVLTEIFLVANFKKRASPFCKETITCLAALAACFISTMFIVDAEQKQNFLSTVFSLMSSDWQFIDFTSRSKVEVPDRRDLLISGGLLFILSPILSKKFSFFAPQLLLFICGLLALVIEQNGLSRNCILMTGSLCLMTASLITYIAQWLHRAGKRIEIFSVIRKPAVWLPLWFLLPLSLAWLAIERAETKISAPLLKETAGNLVTLPAVINKYSNPGDSICFFQRSIYPQFPTLTQLRRSAAGRVITPGSVLAIDRSLPSLSGTGVAKAIELDARLGTMCKNDFVENSPALVFVEQGSMTTKLRNWGIMEPLERDYIIVGTYQLVESNEEPRETIGPRYPIVAYQRKSDIQASHK